MSATTSTTDLGANRMGASSLSYVRPYRDFWAAGKLNLRRAEGFGAAIRLGVGERRELVSLPESRRQGVAYRHWVLSNTPRVTISRVL